MFTQGDVIDSLYRVTGVCSEAGGMGAILFVETNPPAPFPLVLKYCRETDEESLRRFRRETRLLASFSGNSRIVNVVASNPEYDPPYFVMRYYPDGDLESMAPRIRGDMTLLENTILQMIDGIYELHSRNQYHRDIKPQNFLFDGSSLLVSDFGLSTELGSNTAFTRSSVYWGTHGYIPPEFLRGGFKGADASCDIFMLGKTIYAVASGQNPLYLDQGDMPAPLFHLVEKCCSVNKDHRYQSLPDLRQSVVSAFDVLINRGGGLGKVKQLLNSIEDSILREQRFYPEVIREFSEKLALLEHGDKIRLCMDVPSPVFSVLAQPSVQNSAKEFLSSYEVMVDSQGYGWSYAETIASNMQIMFADSYSNAEIKGIALDLAIRAAIYMNRFAAMDTCSTMISSVNQEPLGAIVVALINKHRGSFMDSIEVFNCKNDSIKRAIEANKRSEI